MWVWVCFLRGWGGGGSTDPGASPKKAEVSSLLQSLHTPCDQTPCAIEEENKTKEKGLFQCHKAIAEQG